MRLAAIATVLALTGWAYAQKAKVPPQRPPAPVAPMAEAATQPAPAPSDPSTSADSLMEYAWENLTPPQAPTPEQLAPLDRKSVV